MNIHKPLYALLLLCLSAAVVGVPRELLERLQSDHEALTSAEREFHTLSRKGALDSAEKADYEAYLARLRERVERDCAELAARGGELPDSLPCPSSRLRPIGRVTIDQDAEQTGIERTSALDAELDAGLGEFDELLLREQERVKAERPHASGGAGASPGGGGGRSGEEGAGEAEATTAGGGQGDETAATGGATAGGGSQPPSPPGAGAGGQGRPSKGGTPPDIPDGSDDDVVARQLREAAENEKDPVLKKKLWDEYRKYKKGVR